MMRPVVFNIRIGVRGWGRWLAEHLVQNVPEESAVCEFECQDARCNNAKLAICPKCSSHRERLLPQTD